MSDPSNVESVAQPESAGSADLKSLLAEIDQVIQDAERQFAAVESLAALEEARLAFLGKKGRLAEINNKFGQLSVEDKPQAGRQLNNRKAQIIQLEKERREALERAEIERRLDAEKIDITLPGTNQPRGHAHPVVAVTREVEQIFRSLGFTISQSPEIETEWVNFDALNFLPDHPARDMQDTFFTTRPGTVLRTHTSGNQVRTMVGRKPPLAYFSAGKVYRCDSDVTHSPMFFQMEAYMVDKGISMAHLKGTLQAFVDGVFGKGTKMRFRPSFFPFTEPSAEVDIACVFCKGSGCRVCSNSGWLEILGCGMIHPNVLKNCGIDPEEYSGFALGMGLDRLAMLKYGINNIRLLYENDLRFLTQF